MKDEHPLVLSPGSLVSGEVSRLKANIVLAKKIKETDISRFKVGNCYLIKDESNVVMMINAMGFHPVDQLPCAFGTRISPNELTPHYIHLHLLGSLFNS